MGDVLSRLVPSKLPRSQAADVADAVFGVPARRLGDGPLVLELAALVGCALSAALGSVVGAVICFLVALCTDALASRTAGRLSALLDLAGWGGSVRSVLRWALLLVALGVAWGLAMLVAVALAWLLAVLAGLWSQKTPPILRFQPAGPQPMATHRYARMCRRVAREPLTFVALEALGALALWDLVSGGALGVLAAPAVIGCAVLVVLDGALTLVTALRIARDRGRAEDRLRREVEVSAPHLAVYVSGTVGGAGYMLRQWASTFAALPTLPLMMVREASQLADVLAVCEETEKTPGRDTSSLPTVVWTPLPSHVETVRSWGVRAVFCLQTGPSNYPLWNAPGVPSIFLGHGDSDKASSASPLARMYDEIWVAGPAAIERYRRAGVDVPDERFVLVGRPQVDRLPVGATGHDVPVVLYAPTFEGYRRANDFSSLPTMGVALIERLLADKRRPAVWFRPHPSTGVQQAGARVARERINARLRELGSPHRPLDDTPDVDALDTMASADVLITDVSSLASDFLQTERPIIVLNPSGLTVDEFRAAYPAHGASYLVGADLDGLEAALDAALGDDPLKQQRLLLKKQVLGDWPDGPLHAFLRQSARLLGTRDRSAEGTSGPSTEN